MPQEQHDHQEEKIISPAPVGGTPDLAPAEPPAKRPAQSMQSRQPHKVWAIFGTVVLCFTASFLGAWLFLATGWVRPDASRTITDNSQKIAQQQGEVIASVFKKVNPSTVAITTEATVSGGANRLGELTTQQVEGAGSGIIISKDGYVMTNKHVVPDGTGAVTVTTSDGKEFKNVKVVGRDPSNDIAFLKISGANDLTPAQFGDSDAIQPGQQVVAIGNALGIFRNSVTSGIISGIGRPLTASDESGATSEQLDDMFQTDAAINPGNSGGPLVNLNGEVIGMNTAVSQEGQGIGFAIPVNDAKVEINAIVNQGKLIKAYIGVRYVTLTPDTADQLGIAQTSGALVTGGNGQPAVMPGSPAEKAGIQANDIITKVGTTMIEPGKGLGALLSEHAPGDKVSLTVLRGGKEQTITVTLENYPQ